LQQFLLCLWADAQKEWKGTPAPPLCYWSDPAIAKFFNLVVAVNKGPMATEHRVYTTWKRLGLRKSTKVQFWTVEKVRRKIIISDLRHHRKAIWRADQSEHKHGN
jgi:hypothetical protein